jgi:hypothetical protein
MGCILMQVLNLQVQVDGMGILEPADVGVWLECAKL